MAYIQKNNRYYEVKSGCYKGKIIKYNSNGKKVTKNGDVFNQGYLTIELSENVTVKQYVLVAPWRTFFFYKLLKAIDRNLNVKEKYLNFNIEELIGKEVVIEIEYEFNGCSTYPNIINAYNIEDGEKIIAYEKIQEEIREQQMKENSFLSIDTIVKKSKEFKPLIDIGYNDENTIDF